MTDAPPEIKTRVVLKRVLLSRRPGASSWGVALGSVLILFLVSIADWMDLYGLSSYLSAKPEQVFKLHQGWRLLTTIGVHADFAHLLSNAGYFGGLAYLLYGYFGLSLFPLLVIPAGVLTTAAALWSYEPGTTLVGASGVVYLMAGAWIALYFMIERRLRLSQRWLRCMGFALILGVPQTFEPQVSYRTHAIGFGFGICLGLAYFLVSRKRIRAAEVYVREIVDEEEIVPELP